MPELQSIPRIIYLSVADYVVGLGISPAEILLEGAVKIGLKEELACRADDGRGRYTILKWNENTFSERTSIRSLNKNSELSVAH